ncbi:MAG: DUF4271 domain-containing protein [Prolixibacteraceae bacterium]
MFPSLFVIFAQSISNLAMEFLYTSFLSQQKTKTGQSPRKGAKVLPKKSAKKVLQQTKEKPKAPKELTEEEKIIQAAERYHQQISGKKTDKTTTPGSATQTTVTAPSTQKAGTTVSGPAPQTAAPSSRNTMVVPSSQRSVNDQGTSKNANPVSLKVTSAPVAPKVDSPAKAGAEKVKVEKATAKTKAEKLSEKKSGAAFRKTGSNAQDVLGSAEERELTMNIYSGNPGIYQTEGDTLNFWSLTPMPLDTLATKVTVAEIPGKPYGFIGKPMKATGQDWTFFLILIGWTIFASLRFGFSKYIVQVFQSIFNFTISSRLFREQGYNNNFGPFRLNLIFYLFLPFPIYLIAKDNGVSMMGFSGIELYVIVLVVVNAYFLTKILLYKLMGSIFSQKEITGELVFNMMLYHNVLGMVMLPVATFHSFVPALGFVSLFIVPGLILIFYLLSLLRSIYFAIRTGISIFYLILYLCALEILPVLLVVKLATGQ